MKTIVINLSKDLKNLNEIKQAIKVFLKKTKYTLHIIGTEEQLNAMIGTDDLVLDFIKKDASEEDYLNKSLNIIKANEAVGFLSFSNVNVLVPFVDSNFDEITKTKACALLYPTKVYNKSTLILDTAINKTINKEQAEDLYSYADLFLKTVAKVKKTNFGLLNNLNILDKDFKKNPNYVGLIRPFDFLENKTDIIISDATSSSLVIDAIRGGFYTLLLQTRLEIDKSAFFKLGEWHLKSVKRTINSKIDTNIISNGYFFIGYNQNIVSINNDAKFISVQQALNFLKGLDESEFNKKLKELKK